MASLNQDLLAAALSNAGRPGEITAPKAYAHHQAYLADIERIRRQHAEAIKTTPGFSHAMGCFLSPKAEIDFINSQIEADRVSSVALQHAAE